MLDVEPKAHPVGDQQDVAPLGSSDDSIDGLPDLGPARWWLQVLDQRFEGFPERLLAVPDRCAVEVEFPKSEPVGWPHVRDEAPQAALDRLVLGQVESRSATLAAAEHGRGAVDQHGCVEAAYCLRTGLDFESYLAAIRGASANDAGPPTRLLDIDRRIRRDRRGQQPLARSQESPSASRTKRASWRILSRVEGLVPPCASSSASQRPEIS